MATVDEMIVKWSMDSKGFNDGITQINRSMKLVSSEFSATDSKLKNFGNTTDQLKNKQKYLSDSLELQKNKVENLRKAYDNIKEKTGENSAQTEKLGIQLNKAVSYYNKLENELKQTSKELEEQSNKWNKLSATMKSAGEKMSSVGSKLSGIGSTLSTRVTLPIVAAGAAMFKLASDTQESVNKVEVAFGSAADSVLEWSKTTLQSYGMARGTALDMASTYGDMATSMGLTDGQAGEMSKTLVGLAGDLSSFKNISISEADTALKSIFTGETESLKSLGAVMTQANLDAFALANGFNKTTKDMTESEKVNLRYAFVMERTRKSQGDYARTSKDAANQMQTFTETLKELGATFGEVILPVITPIIAKLNEWLLKFKELSPETQSMIIKIAAIAAAVGPLITVIGKVVSVGGTLATVFSKVSTAIGAAGGVLPMLGKGLAVLTGPIGIVVGAIAGLVAIFVALYKNNEDFRNKMNEVWGQIKSIVSTTLESLKVIFSVFVENFKIFWAKYGDDIMTNLASLFTLIADVVTTVLNVIKNIIVVVMNLIQGDWSGAWEAMKTLVSDFWSGIVSIIGGIVDVLVNIVRVPIQTIGNIFSSVWEGIRNTTVSIWTGIARTIQSVINGVIRGTNGMIRTLNSLQFDVPDWVPGLGGKTFGLNISELREVSWLHEGGIIDKPTLLGNYGVGDKYKGTGRNEEAVIPLDSMYNKLRNIVKEEQSTQPIYIVVNVDNNVDSKAIGNAVTTKITKEINRKINNYQVVKGGI